MRAVSPAAVQIPEATNASAPDDHFGTGPHCRVLGAAQRRVHRAGRRPTILGRVVSAARVRNCRARRTISTPDDHFAAGPYCRVRVSGDRDVNEGCGHPTIRAWVISSARVRVVKGFVPAAPNNHFIAGPDCGVSDPAKRHIHKTSRHPTVDNGIVSAASAQVGMVRDRIRSTPDNHFAARPHCGVIPSCRRHIDRAGQRPTVRARIVSPAAV